eukprot:scaffold356_cov106-Cylindrotheca_fusiformis.AAC.1
MGWQTREGGLKPKEELFSSAKPVVLSPDTQLCELAPELEPTVEDPSRGSPIFKVLLWPELCSPPVGLCWPTTTTFQEFCDSLKGNTVYTAFLDCCGPESMVEKWFTRVNKNPTAFVVHMADATPLWQALPSPHQPRGQAVLNVELITPFQYQFDRFLWALHCDRVQRSIGACSTRVEKVAFSWYLHYTAKLYPEDLCDSKAPASHQAFTGYLFRPNQSGWPDSARNLLAGFDSLDGVTQVPSELHEFRPTVVPTIKDNSYVPVRLTFAAPTVDLPHDVPVPVVHTQTAAPSPAPGPEPAAAAGPPPLVTPAGAARGAASIAHPPGSPAIFSISTTSVQQPPVMNPLPASGTNPPLQQPYMQPTQHSPPAPMGQGGTLPPAPAPPQIPAQSVPHQYQPPSALPTTVFPAPPAPGPVQNVRNAAAHQTQNSPPWWAPHHGSGGQTGGQSSFQSPQGVSHGPNPSGSGVVHAPAASAFPASHPQQPQPTSTVHFPSGPSVPPMATAQVFSPSTSNLRDPSRSTGSVGLPQAPQRNLFGVQAGGPGGSWSGSSSSKSPQYVSMMDAGIGSAGLRAVSPPTFLALCFLLCHHRDLSAGTQVRRLSDGTVIPVDSFVLLRQPCLVARPVLREMASTSKDICTPMLHYLQGRIRSHPVIGRMGVPVNFAFCTNDFVESAFNLSRWLSVTHEPLVQLSSGSAVPSDSKPAFHPLFFHRALASSLPLDKVPATGYSRSAAVVLGSVILFFYQFLDIKVDQMGHVPDTTSFDKSCFGTLLASWAGVPASPIVDAVWTAHPLRCSAWWIAHLLELFKIFYDHHSQRVMLLGETNPAVGIDEVLITPPGETVVVGTNYLPTRETAFRSHSNLQDALANLEQRMRQLWEDQVALGPHAPIWSASFPSHLCQDSESSTQAPTGVSASASGRSSQSRADASESQRKRSRQAAAPFVPRKPLMAFSASASSAPQESPFLTL